MATLSLDTIGPVPRSFPKSDTFSISCFTFSTHQVSPLLLSIPVSVLVILVALGLAGGGAYGVTHMTYDLAKIVTQPCTLQVCRKLRMIMTQSGTCGMNPTNINTSGFH